MAKGATARVVTDNIIGRRKSTLMSASVGGEEEIPSNEVPDPHLLRDRHTHGNSSA